jgi:hypothetical protein
MVVPILEIVLTNIGNHTINDVSTEDGKQWLGAFTVAAREIPGLVRAGWGRSYEDSEIAMHFIGKYRSTFRSYSMWGNIVNIMAD